MKDNNKIGRCDFSFLKKLEKINVILIFFSIVDKRVSYANDMLRKKFWFDFHVFILKLIAFKQISIKKNYPIR